MNKVNTYTSTGLKLLNHHRALDLFKNQTMPTPISLQVAPTSRCNLKCEFCSNVNRGKDEVIDFPLLMNVMKQLTLFGLKTVEFTGGGDPTMYPRINELISESLIAHKLKVGFITNGIKLSVLSEYNLSHLSWLRISMNCLDYIDSINIPADNIKGTLGFSYVMNNRTNEDVLQRLQKHVDEYKPAYVRIVPNCQSTHEEQERHNKEFGEMVAKWGEPYFYQIKRFERPKECWWGYFKPFVLHDGWVYPCSSVVLNESADRQFHSKFRWVSLADLPGIYCQKAVPLKTSGCSHCVFTQQNNLASDILNMEMEDFI